MVAHLFLLCSFTLVCYTNHLLCLSDILNYSHIHCRYIYRTPMLYDFSCQFIFMLSYLYTIYYCLSTLLYSFFVEDNNANLLKPSTQLMMLDILYDDTRCQHYENIRTAHNKYIYLISFQKGENIRTTHNIYIYLGSFQKRDTCYLYMSPHDLCERF